VYQFAVDFITENADSVATAYVAHLFKFGTGPDATCRILGVAEEKKPGLRS
jgi:hypothetical protein